MSKYFIVNNPTKTITEIKNIEEFFSSFSRINLESFLNMGLYVNNNLRCDFSSYSAFIHIYCPNSLLAFRVFCFLNAGWILSMFPQIPISTIFIFGQSSKSMFSIHVGLSVIPDYEVLSTYFDIVQNYLKSTVRNLSDNISYDYRISTSGNRREVIDEPLSIRSKISSIPNFGSYFLQFDPDLQQNKINSKQQGYNLDVAQHFLSYDK